LIFAFVLKPQVSSLKPPQSRKKTMNDDRIRLRRLIDELRAQLAGSTSVEAGLRSRLEQTLSDTEKAMADPAGQPAGSERLGKRLNEAAINFEVSHPTLAAEVSSIIDAIGRMGI
jgi:hypothetical protein